MLYRQDVADAGRALGARSMTRLHWQQKASIAEPCWEALPEVGDKAVRVCDPVAGPGHRPAHCNEVAPRR